MNQGLFKSNADDDYQKVSFASNDLKQLQFTQDVNSIEKFDAP